KTALGVYAKAGYNIELFLYRDAETRIKNNLCGKECQGEKRKGGKIARLLSFLGPSVLRDKLQKRNKK
ncbi:MAG: hypothetical protein M0P61_01910, partial [Ignavibacteriaceae bacterium]|nr:hypothetical protein [Ignavibacteriaceae bacterium]